MQVVPIPRKGKKNRQREGSLTVPPALRTEAIASARPALKVEPRVVKEVAQELGALRAHLPPEGTPAAEEDRLIVEIDPQAAVVARSLGAVLPFAPEVAQRAGTGAEDLSGRLGQLQAMGALHAEAVEADARFEHSAAVLGDLQQRLRQEIREAVPRLLEAGQLRPELLSRMATAWKAVCAEEDLLEGKAEQRRAEGRRRAQAEDEERKAMARREVFTRTLIDLKNDRPVEATDLADAAEAYEELTAPANDNRRTKER